MIEKKTSPYYPEIPQRMDTDILIRILLERDLTPKQVATLQQIKSNKEAIAANHRFSNTSDIIENKKKPNVEKYVNSIIKSNVNAKLPPGAEINGTKITQFNGFYDHGPNPEELTVAQKETYQLIINIYHNQRLYPEFINSQVVSITSSPDEKNKTLTMHFFQDKDQIDSRGYYTPAHVSVEMETTLMNRFLEKLKNEPDLLEELYQKSFVGSDEEEDKPGMRRASSNQFFLIENHVPTIEMFDKKGATTFLNTVKKFIYKNGPYGTGKAFSPSK